MVCRAQPERMQKLLSVADAAELTGASVSFWRKQIANQSVPVVKIGRLVRLRSADIEDYLTRRTRPARTGADSASQAEGKE
jgi:excisionase family DNA binding protein